MYKQEEPILIRRIYSWLVVALTGAFAVFVLSLAVTIGMNLVDLFDVRPAEASEGLVPSPTATEIVVRSPTAMTSTVTPLPTSTPFEPTPLPPTATPLPAETAMPEPTQTATPMPTPTVVPVTTSTVDVTPTPETDSSESPADEGAIDIPVMINVDDDVHWIDVDLSEQRLTAYVGKMPVRSYLVSTGLPQTPTPVGQYAIWIKLRYDDMAGADYYIEDVPFVMYFHEGYGFHGVTWHANFGHRMSHGCVNQPNDMAEWLFNFAEVGTMVNIHE
jgi:lipoprotein-anchoring transpeptidase ErfK/SrfK